MPANTAIITLVFLPAPFCRCPDDRAAIRVLRRNAAGVSENLVTMVVQLCRGLGISIQFAAYETDAQLAWMCRVGLVDCTLADDGDVIIYGSPCAIFRIDTGTGEALLFRADLVSQLKPTKGSLMHLYQKFGVFIFAAYGALVGCDYMSGKGVQGFGETTTMKALTALKKGATSADNIIAAMKKVAPSLDADEFARAAMRRHHI